MKLSLRRHGQTAGADEVVGPARVDRRTKSLTKRLRPGDVAVIDHLDLDRVAAEALVACRPAAVLNAARSTSVAGSCNCETGCQSGTGRRRNCSHERVGVAFSVTGGSCAHPEGCVQAIAHASSENTNAHSK